MHNLSVSLLVDLIPYDGQFSHFLKSIMQIKNEFNFNEVANVISLHFFGL